jgi:OOP family OmpA-OmpF porin
MKKTVLLACLATSISAVTVADEYPDFEAYLGAGMYMLDDDLRNLDDAFSLEGGLELPLNTTMSLEAWLSDFTADVKNGSGDVDVQRYNLGTLFHLKDGVTRPFISVGASHFDADGYSESLINLGLGVKQYYDNNIILRGELMAMNSIDNEVTEFGARLAIGYAFGRSVAAPVVEAAPAPVVKKVVEKVVEKKVEEKPAPAPVVEPVKPEPAPVDSDNDGVVDANDKCPNTNAAFKVDATGCPVMLTESVEIQMNVKFANNSAVVTAENFSEIQKVADFMQQFDKTEVTVEGYSDDRGRAAYNKSLSQKRADAVRTTLINEFKIPAARITAIGYGEENPIADNATAEGRAKNRRVVGVVKAQVEKAVTK